MRNKLNNGNLTDKSAELQQFFFEELVRRMAVTINGTEAAGFILNSDEELLPATHLRPGTSTLADRRRAIETMRQIACEGIKARRDVISEVDSNQQSRIYAFVVRLKDDSILVACVVVIAPAIDYDDAREKMDLLLYSGDEKGEGRKR